jgi:branched-chain amino acid transport system substrate-binding protein
VRHRQAKVTGVLIAGTAAALVMAGCSSGSGGGSGASGGGGSSAKGNPIVIGVSASLTGEYSFIGVDGSDGIKLAASQINAAGGIDGRPITLDVEDDGSSASQALPNMSKFVQDQSVLAVLGASASAILTPLGSVANSSKLFMGAVDANSPSIGATGPYAMSMSDSGDELQAPLATFAVQTSGKRLAAADDTDNSAYVSLAQEFGTDVKTSGGQYLDQEGLLSTTQDVSSIATKIAALSPNGVFLGLVPTQTATFIQEIGQAAGKGVGYYAPFGDATDDFLTAGGSSINGVVVSANFGSGSSALAQSFTTAFEKAYNKAPDDPSAIGYAALEWIAARLKTSSDINGISRTEAQQLITKGGSEPSVLGHGTMTVTAKEQVTFPPALLKVENGSFATLTSGSSGAAASPSPASSSGS